MEKGTLDEQLMTLERSLAFLNASEGDDRDKYAAALYTPDPRLASKIAEAEVLRAAGKAADTAAAGRLMEAIAYLAFQSLRGVQSLQSYASAGPQHDLLVNGSENGWKHVIEYLRLDQAKRGILIESKATKKVLGDDEFARLCSILHLNFPQVVGLGVFFTLKGASGFPKPGQRQAALRDARMRQVMFHARTLVPVVVLQWEDVRSLAAPGALLRILEKKIRDVQELSGLPAVGGCAAQECDLPDHLRALARVLT